ncbi:MAG: cell division protein ZipA C-terminal FtsZ-binding domain-containing protein, partial [Steroidobacter sp.]
MNELRWILIGFGIVLLAGIYLWGRRGGAAVAEDVVLRNRPEPPPQSHGFADAHREPDDVPAYQRARVEEPPSDDQPAVDYEVTAVRPAPSPTPSFAREAPRSVNRDPLPPTEPARPNTIPDFRRSRVEPTLGSDEVTQELQTQPMSAMSAAAAPTLSSSDTPQPRRSDRRKILSLRLSLAPQRVEGAKLQEVLQSELLNHGRYDIFHREHGEGQSVFSIASMVEPGTFDLEKMTETLYPGVTLFAQLPGPVPGMHALNEMVACARRLHSSLGGVLQDDRGVPLTVHRIERMRQEVRE